MKTWCIVKVINGRADRIAQGIEQSIQEQHLESQIAKVVAPDAGKMPVPERITGALINSGYSDKLLVYMEPDNETRRRILGMIGVIGFAKEFDLLQHEEVTGIDLRQWCAENGYHPLALVAPDAVEENIPAGKGRRKDLIFFLVWLIPSALAVFWFFSSYFGVSTTYLVVWCVLLSPLLSLLINIFRVGGLDLGCPLLIFIFAMAYIIGPIVKRALQNHAGQTVSQQVMPETKFKSNE